MLGEVDGGFEVIETEMASMPTRITVATMRRRARPRRVFDYALGMPRRASNFGQKIGRFPGCVPSRSPT